MDKETSLLSINHPEAISRAAAMIKKGGVIAFPTDTVYGVGVSAFDETAIEQIYQIKERSKEKAIPILVGEAGDIQGITPAPDSRVSWLMEKFWPGALTLVLPLLPEMPSNLSSKNTIGLRLPNHIFAQELLLVTGPLAVTSANPSGEESARTAQDVLRTLSGKIDLILDGGKTPGGEASTVLDCISDPPRILREGPILEETIQKLIKERPWEHDH